MPVIAQPSRLIRDILAEITLKRPDLSRNSCFVIGSEVLPKSSTLKDCGLLKTSQIQLLGDLLISITTETWVQTTVEQRPHTSPSPNYCSSAGITLSVSSMIPFRLISIAELPSAKPPINHQSKISDRERTG